MSSKQPVKMVILDRDGVINDDSKDYIKSPGEWRAIPGSLEAIARLNQAGIKVAVATNQSGVARGLLTLQTLEAIHEKMHQAVGAVGGMIDAVFFCPHHPGAGCGCRKPAPGLLLQAQMHFGIDLSEAVFMGDSLCDVQAALAAGAQPVLVRTGKGGRTLVGHAEMLSDVPVIDCLGDFYLDIPL